MCLLLLVGFSLQISADKNNKDGHMVRHRRQLGITEQWKGEYKIEGPAPKSIYTIGWKIPKKFRKLLGRKRRSAAASHDKSIIDLSVKDDLKESKVFSRQRRQSGECGSGPSFMQTSACQRYWDYVLAKPKPKMTGNLQVDLKRLEEYYKGPTQ